MLFEMLHSLYSSTSGRMSAKQIDERVMSVLAVWREWSLFAPIFVFGLEAAFTRSLAESTSMITFTAEELQRDVSKDDLENVRRRARQMGISLMYRPSTDENEPSLSDVEEILQLERKIQFVTNFVASRQVVPASDDDIDGVPYDPEEVDIDGVPYTDENDIDGVPFDNIDGEPMSMMSSSGAMNSAGSSAEMDDIDGIPFEEDDIDGVPFE